jgi:hypothetical protein
VGGDVLGVAREVRREQGRRRPRERLDEAAVAEASELLKAGKGLS